MVISKRMKAKKLPVYITAQFLGAFLAGLAIYILFSPSISAFENAHNIVRGTAESVQTAKMFGEYYAAPGSASVVSLPLAIGYQEEKYFFIHVFSQVVIISIDDFHKDNKLIKSLNIYT